MFHAVCGSVCVRSVCSVGVGVVSVCCVCFTLFAFCETLSLFCETGCVLFSLAVCGVCLTSSAVCVWLNLSPSYGGSSLLVVWVVGGCSGVFAGCCGSLSVGSSFFASGGVVNWSSSSRVY